MKPPHTFSSVRRRGLWLLAVLVVASAACSSDPEETEPETTPATETTTAVVEMTTSTIAQETSADTTAATTSTTLLEEEFPGPTVLAYLEEIRDIAVASGQAALAMRAANNDWDNRSVTGVSFDETEADMVAVRDETRRLRDAIGVVEPPTGFGLPVEHQTAWVASGEMADAAVEALAGLRSPDTGERRRAALSDFVVAFERFNGAVDRIVDIIGVGAGIELPTITVATTAATTTTTTEATTTTAAATTTAATTAATTTTVADSTTTTLPAVADISYAVIDERELPDPVRVLLTVTVEAGSSKEQLARLGARLAADYRLGRQYQALHIEFSHFGEPEASDTLGTWTDAPNGDWEQAGDVQPGNYSQHQLADHTVEKDWSLLPTDAQMEVYRGYLNFQTAHQVETGESLPEDDLIPLAAERLGLDTEVISDAIDAWSAWVGA